MGLRAQPFFDTMNIIREILESPDVLHPIFSNVQEHRALRDQFPLASVWELCGNCMSEIIVPAYREGICPTCGEKVRPCAMCLECAPEGGCPFEQGEE